jgi:hypothetical protein
MNPLLGAQATIADKRITIRKISPLFGLLVRDGFDYYWTHQQPTDVKEFTPSLSPIVVYQVTVDLAQLASARVPLALGMDVFLPAMDLYAKMGVGFAVKEYPEFEKGKATICALGESGLILRYDDTSDPFFLSCMELEDCMVVQQTSFLTQLMLIEPGAHCFVSEWLISTVSMNRQLIIEVQDNPIRPLDFFVKIDGIGWLPRTLISLDASDFCQPRDSLSLNCNHEPQELHLSLNCRFFFVSIGKRSYLVKWNKRFRLAVVKFPREPDRLRFARSLKLSPSQKRKFVTSVALYKRGYLELV